MLNEASGGVGYLNRKKETPKLFKVIKPKLEKVIKDQTQETPRLCITSNPKIGQKLSLVA